MKINSTKSYDFFLARTYRARIKLMFTNTRGIQYSPYISLCVFERNTSILMNIENGILNVPKHGNKHDLIHFITVIHRYAAWLHENQNPYVLVFLNQAELILALNSTDHAWDLSVIVTHR